MPPVSNIGMFAHDDKGFHSNINFPIFFFELTALEIPIHSMLDTEIVTPMRNFKKIGIIATLTLMERIIRTKFVKNANNVKKVPLQLLLQFQPQPQPRVPKIL